MNILTVAIEKMVANGFALGRLVDGRVILVRGALPGETVRVRSILEKKQFILGEVHEVVRASKDRVEPPCQLYGRCGGCDFQHVAGASQLRLKRSVLLEFLMRTGGLDPVLVEEVTSEPIPSPSSFYYRQRIRLHLDDHGRPGFCRYHSRQVEPISHCPLARKEINEVLERLVGNDRALLLFRQADFLELMVNPDSGRVILMLHVQGKPRPAEQAAARDLEREITRLDAILWFVDKVGIVDRHNRRVEGDAAILMQQTFTIRDISANPLVLTWEAGGFSQVNREQNANLIDRTVSWTRKHRPRRVLDLYCGMGNFAIPLSFVADDVLGLEVQGSAIRSARRNAELAGRTNCLFIKGAVEKGVAELIEKGEIFDLIVLDPPRQGAAEVVTLLPSLRPRHVIYISCDPATLSRDLAVLLQNGYDLAEIQLFDMFPQTHHLESAALLERTQGA